MHLQALHALGSRRLVTLDPDHKGLGLTLSTDKLTVTLGSSTYWQGIRSTIGVTTGKWFWETTYIVAPPSGGQGYAPGVCNSVCTLASKSLGGDSTNNWVTEWFSASGAKFGPSDNGTAYAVGTTVAGSVIGCALDMDAGTLGYYNNGVYKGQAFTGISGEIYPVLFLAYSGAFSARFNFGIDGFNYTPPAGFNALVL